jgi:hypothetical protein
MVDDNLLTQQTGNRFLRAETDHQRAAEKSARERCMARTTVNAVPAE